MYMFYIVNFVEARAIHSLNSESDFSHLAAFLSKIKNVHESCSKETEGHGRLVGVEECKVDSLFV